MMNLMYAEQKLIIGALTTDQKANGFHGFSGDTRICSVYVDGVSESCVAKGSNNLCCEETHSWE